MLEPISEERLTKVAPQLAAKVRQMAELLEAEGIKIRVVQGLRTFAEQDQLYAIGRTAPGRRVTNVQGGYSWHNYGLAVDVVPSINSVELVYQPDWDNKHAAWGRMVDVGKSVGLVPGALWRTFPDFPHFQLNGRFPVGAPNDEVREIYRLHGIEAVWQEAGI